MYNFEHEIDIPDNKAIRYYLWSDYFHDSQIISIDFIDSSRKQKVFINPTGIRLTVVCDRDYEKESHPGPKEKYIYYLIFEDCIYHHFESEGYGNVYLNGRFKDSVLLPRFEQQEQKHYYHLRIQTTGGYFDIIFKSFRIKKQQGKAKITGSDDFETIKEWSNRFKNENGIVGICKIEEMASIDDRDSLNQYFALSYLARYSDVCVSEIARRILRKPWEEYSEERIASVWILGRQGELSDLPALTDEYIAEDGNNIGQRHIMDAIERIRHRVVTS